jgi:hypothetical protein
MSTVTDVINQCPDKVDTETDALRRLLGVITMPSCTCPPEITAARPLLKAYLDEYVAESGALRSTRPRRGSFEGIIPNCQARPSQEDILVTSLAELGLVRAGLIDITQSTESCGRTAATRLETVNTLISIMRVHQENNS